MVHMYLAGFIVTGFIVAGVYAFGRLRGRWGRYERVALAIPLTGAALASPVQVVVGDWAGREVAAMQPVKLASFEGLERTERGAPISIGPVKVPHALSLLAFHRWDARVQGLQTVPAADRPPVGIVKAS